MSEAATDTSCFGETSMNWTCSFGVARMKSPAGARSRARRPAHLLVRSRRWPARSCTGPLPTPTGRRSSGSNSRPFFFESPRTPTISSASTMSPALYFAWPPALVTMHVVDHAAVLHLAVGRLDEAELVDPREARQRRDQADVRAFRRLNRADAAVVRRVHVAHLEARALARQTAWPERRETPLVRDLGERVGLVHELRQLARPEELADRGHDRLGVDQVVRHGGRHFLVDRHLFLDRTLHPDQADAELVLEQLAHRAHAPVAEVIDVVHVGRVLPQLQQVLDDLVEVLRVQDLLVERRLQLAASCSASAGPTREKSYFCGLKNMFSKSDRLLSSVGGSPGRRRR